MTATTMTACGGNECASGTTEKDGQCVPTSTLTCGDGTMLADGACVPTNTTTCGDGTMLADGKCVPTSTTECGDGTMLVNGECVPNSTLTCGAGTMEMNGACVPTSTLACGAGTVENNGNCVVAMAACGTGTQLDANSGTCVVTDMVCGTGTAFTNNTCLPTAAVCATGTTFNDMTGTCLPDATCQVGDVVLGGVCVRPVQQLLAGATVTEAENNDPTLGGTAQALTIPAAGTQLVVAGGIDAPTDLDADMEVDQDLDGFTVTLAAGDLIQVAVQPVAGPSLGFLVFGPDGTNYTRSSTLGLTQGAARQIFAPVAGEYTIVVAPAAALSGNIGPIGNADWKYALTLEQLAAPTAADVDASMTAMSGQFANLNDNLFRATNLSGGLAQLTVGEVGEHVEGVYYVGSSLATMTRVFPAVSGNTQVLSLAAGENLVFFDWTEATGPDTAFELTAGVPANLQALGALTAAGTDSTAVTIPGNGNFFYSISAADGGVVRIAQRNTGSSSARVTVTGAGASAGLNITFPATLSNTSVGSTSPNYLFASLPAGGDYVISVENTSATPLADVVVSAALKAPTDLGSKAPAEPITWMGGPTTVKDRDYATVTFTENVRISGTVVAASGDPDFAMYNAATGVNVFRSTGGSATETISERVLPAGTYLIEIFAFTALPSYTVTLNTTLGPISEMEPNNDAMTASALPAGRDGAGSFVAGDSDFFTITVPNAIPAGSALRIALTPTASTGSTPTYTCTLRDAAGVTLATSTSINDCFIHGAALAAGTYTLELSTTATTANNYSFAASVVTGFNGIETEPNNDAATATALVLPSTIHGDSVAGASVDSDFYTLTLANPLAAGELLAIKTDAQFGRSRTTSFTTELRDSMGAVITSGASITRGNLAAGTYTVVVRRSSSSTTTTGRYALDARVITLPNPEFTAMPAAPIVSAPVTSTIAANKPNCNIAEVRIHVDITHEYRNDMRIDITGPDNTTVRLQNSSFSSGADLVGIYPLTLTPAASLAAFNGKAADGNWRLDIVDTFTTGDDGVLNSWGVSFVCAP